jgi:hypothetical protein
MGEDRDRRKFWWFWFIWGLAFFVIEGYAILTKEVLVPTLSRTWWWIRRRWKIWIPSIAMTILLVWLWFHFALGECALGLC